METQFSAVMTIGEAAEYLRCSREHIYNLMRRGELLSVRAGGRRLIRKSDMDAFIERNVGPYTPRPKRYKKVSRSS